MAAGQKRGNGKPGFGLGGGNGERRGRKGLKRRSVNKPKGGDGALGGGASIWLSFQGTGRDSDHRTTSRPRSDGDDDGTATVGYTTG
jgi:hypothetical protein